MICYCGQNTKGVFSKMEINKDMTISSVLTAVPSSAEVFLSYGMHCLGCPGAKSETVEFAAIKHGANLDEMLAKLNALSK